jgi:hypothetical protein
LFKMSVNGVAFENDMVEQTQPNDNLHNAWMMFNHINCVQGWKTMAYHIYDLVYCKFMTIVVVTCNTRTWKLNAFCQGS